MVFSTLIVQTTTSIKFQNIFITPTGNPEPIKLSLFTVPSSQSLATTIQLSVSTDLPILDISYIYIHTHTHTHTHTYIYKIIQYVTICAQILLLSIFSRLIHVIACIVCYFIPYYWKYYFIIWTNHILSIHLLMEIQLLDQCQFWAIVNSAAMSICVQVFAEYLFSIFWVYTWKWDCWVIWYSMLNLISLFF